MKFFSIYCLLLLTKKVYCQEIVGKPENYELQETVKNLETFDSQQLHILRQNEEANQNFEPRESWEVYAVEEMAGLFQGDIKLSEEELQRHKGDIDFNSINGHKYRWTDATVPYVIDPASNYTSFEIQVIMMAIEEYYRYTCLKWIPRTNQANYVHIFSGHGCYSEVGMTGGVQDISLKHPTPGDSGTCMIQGIIQHEMMHCSGFHHEQCRSDRDNYVIINRTNVTPGHAHNFDKYGARDVNPLGTLYDYSSILHYGEYSFSKNKGHLPTIITKNPVDQTIIGQRRSFSANDVLKINKYYNCPVPYNVPKPSGNLCGWTQDYTVALDGHSRMYDQYNDDFDWMMVAGSTPTYGTGPTEDHTTSTQLGRYIYAEASKPRLVGDVARIRSPMIQANGSVCITFWYHMYTIENANVDPMGGLRVLVTTNADATNQKLIWLTRGNGGDIWHYATIDYNPMANFQVAFEAVVGETYSSDIANDDFFVGTGYCSSMKPEHPTIGNPLKCTFEAGSCGYIQAQNDEYDWTLTSGPVGPIPSGYIYDFGKNYMIAIGGRPSLLGDKARLMTPVVRMTGTSPTSTMCLHFHLFFVPTATASLSVFTSSGITLYKTTGPVNHWHLIKIGFSVPFNSKYQIIFEATKGAGPVEDFIAVDSIEINQC